MTPGVRKKSLGTETVKSLSLAFEGIHDVEGGDSLSAGMLCVCDSVPDHVGEEGLEDATGFFIHKSRNAFHTTSTSQSSDSRFGDALDVLAHDLAMALGTSLTFASFSFVGTRHV